MSCYETIGSSEKTTGNTGTIVRKAFGPGKKTGIRYVQYLENPEKPRQSGGVIYKYVQRGVYQTSIPIRPLDRGFDVPSFTYLPAARWVPSGPEKLVAKVSTSTNLHAMTDEQLKTLFQEKSVSVSEDVETDKGGVLDTSGETGTQKAGFIPLVAGLGAAWLLTR